MGFGSKGPDWGEIRKVLVSSGLWAMSSRSWKRLRSHWWRFLRDQLKASRLEALAQIWTWGHLLPQTLCSSSLWQVVARSDAPIALIFRGTNYIVNSMRARPSPERRDERPANDGDDLPQVINCCRRNCLRSLAASRRKGVASVGLLSIAPMSRSTFQRDCCSYLFQYGVHAFRSPSPNFRRSLGRPALESQ